MLALLVAVGGCGGSGGAAPSRCGHGHLTSVSWSGAAVGGGVGLGVWYDSGDPGSGAAGGEWYDPADTYDPATDPGGAGDPSGTGNTSGGDTSGGDTAGGDTSGGDTAGGDTTLAEHHLTLSNVPVAPIPPGADGCWTCTVGCTTGSGAAAAGRQAVGASETSYDDACGAAVQSLEQWAHDTQRQRVQSCQQMRSTALPGRGPPSSTTRAPATPTIGRPPPKSKRSAVPPDRRRSDVMAVHPHQR
jgi:hypothetical protein